MEFKTVKQFHKLDDLELNNIINPMDDIIKRVSENYNKKREEQIIEALKKRGHVFQNKEQLYEFAKKCVIHTFEKKPNYKELWYEDELVCIWSEKMSSEISHNNIKTMFTITIG